MLLRLLAVAVLAPVVFPIGCGGSGVDKVSGVQAGAVTTLTLANGNIDPVELQPWLDEVSTLSKGRLRINVLSGWREGEPDSESGLISDVRDGRAQLGWVGTRAWTGEGVHSFDALNAPFLVDSYAIEAAVLDGADGQQLLAGVKAAGVEPVGLLPGPLRLLLTRRPIQRVADFQGLRIGVAASQVGERALRELGAVALPIANSASMTGLDAVEGRLGTLAARYIGQAPYLTVDAPLWPRPLVIFANRESWSGLSEDERGIIRLAAERAFEQLLDNAKADDRASIAQLCDAGVLLVSVGADGRDALRRAAEPVYDEVRRQADSRAGLQAVERARAGGQAPEPLLCEPASQPERVPLTGTFVTTLRRDDPGADVIADAFEGAAYIRITLVLANGRARHIETFPDGHTEVGFNEKYTVYRDRITFGGDHGPPDTARWSLDGDELRFSEASGGPEGRFVWESHPWVRIGP